MKHSFFVFLFTILGVMLHAQQVVSTSGNHTENSTAQLSWTIGEPTIKTFSNSGNDLTQGMHQSYLSVSAVYENFYPGFEITAFPNPTTDYVELEAESMDIENLTFQLYDSNGKLLQQKKFENNKATIQTTELLPATYLIKIIKDKQDIKTLKVIKK